MRVAIISSEAVPFAKTGGLGDVAGALPRALSETGEIEPVLVLPLYQQTSRSSLVRVYDSLDTIWLPDPGLKSSVWYTEEYGAPTFLIDAPRYFDRPGVYGYSDDHERFAYLGRASLAFLKKLGNPPDILHFNDWPCGFAAAELSARRNFDAFYSGSRSLFSIHNMAYQGTFDPFDLGRFGFPRDTHDAFMMNGAASALKGGLMTSDALSTVSRRYALEIQTPEFGYGLDWLLRMRRDRLAGITNGVDYEVWNPATDRHLPAHYDQDHLEGKNECRKHLLSRFNLPVESDRPIIAFISRLTPQKGFDLVQQAAGAILETGAILVALGSGERQYEDFLQALRDYAPTQVGIYKGFNEPLAHQIEAGADMFLMPSLFEPCGLNQMYSMRYGTVPIVRATGGLDDTVENFDRVRGSGNGFKFTQYTAHAMLESIYEALYTYGDQDRWRTLQLNGMRADNSWSAAARKYLELYQAIRTL